MRKTRLVGTILEIDGGVLNEAEKRERAENRIMNAALQKTPGQRWRKGRHKVDECLIQMTA